MPKKARQKNAAKPSLQPPNVGTEENRRWTEKHPIYVTAAFVGIVVAAIGAIVTIYQFFRDDLASPTHFEVDGSSVRIVNRDHKVLNSRNLSTRPDWTIYATLKDAETEEASRRILVGMGSLRNEENLLVLFDKHLHVRYKYEFKPDSPFPQVQKDLRLNSMEWIDYRGKRYVVAIFLGARFPTAIVVLDDQLRECGLLLWTAA